MQAGLLGQYIMAERKQVLGPRQVYLPRLDSTVQVPHTEHGKESDPYWNASAYVEGIYRNDWIDMVVGYRHLYDELTDKTGFGPRVGAKWHMTRDHRLKGAFGVHPQAQAFETVWRRDIPVEASLQYTYQGVLGYEQDFGRGFSLSAEAYRKESFDLPREGLVRDPSEAATVIYRDTGRVSSWGIEIYLKNHLLESVFGSATYNFSHTREKGLTGRWGRNQYSIPHSLNLSLGYEFKKEYAIGLLYAYASGTPYTPYDVAASKFAGDAVYDLDNLFGRTGPAYSRLDLRLDSRINYRRYSINSFVTVANVLGRKNRFGRFWDPGRQDVTWFEGFGIFPVGGVAVSF